MAEDGSPPTLRSSIVIEQSADLPPDGFWPAVAHGYTNPRPARRLYVLAAVPVLAGLLWLAFR